MSAELPELLAFRVSPAGALALPPRRLCEHHQCRCARAAELVALADSSGRDSYLLEAIAVHDQWVRCRQ